MVNQKPIAIFSLFDSSLVNVLESITNIYRIPCFSSSHAGPSYYTLRRRIKLKKIKKQSSLAIKSFLNKKSNDLSYISSHITKFKSVQLYLKPNIGSVLVNFINHFNWTFCYYIYNHKDGKYFRKLNIRNQYLNFILF